MILWRFKEFFQGMETSLIYFNKIDENFLNKKFQKTFIRKTKEIANVIHIQTIMNLKTSNFYRHLLREMNKWIWPEKLLSEIRIKWLLEHAHAHLRNFVCFILSETFYFVKVKKVWNDFSFCKDSGVCKTFEVERIWL